MIIKPITPEKVDDVLTRQVKIERIVLHYEGSSSWDFWCINRKGTIRSSVSPRWGMIALNYMRNHFPYEVTTYTTGGECRGSIQWQFMRGWDGIPPGDYSGWEFIQGAAVFVDRLNKTAKELLQREFFYAQMPAAIIPRHLREVSRNLAEQLLDYAGAVEAQFGTHGLSYDIDYGDGPQPTNFSIKYYKKSQEPS